MDAVTKEESDIKKMRAHNQAQGFPALGSEARASKGDWTIGRLWGTGSPERGMVTADWLAGPMLWRGGEA